jgi:hypothetical protein
MIIDELFEAPQMCPECGGISFSDLILAEKKDACYYKVKASAKVWPSAYASGRLVQCRKKGAANYGNKSEGVMEMDKSQTPPGRDGSNDPDAGKKEYTAKPITSKTAAKDAVKILNKVFNKKTGVAEGSSTDNLLAKSGFKEIRKMKHGAEYSNGHEAVSIKFDPSDPDVINWALGEVRGKRIDWFESGNDDKQEALHIIKTFTKQGVAEGSDESYMIIRTDKEGKQDVFAGNFDTYEQAQKELNACLAHPLHTKYKQKFEIKRKGQPGVAEGEQQPGADYRDPKEADYGPEYQDMVARVKKLAGLGPMKTVYDPARRQYRNMPTAVQPKK